MTNLSLSEYKALAEVGAARGLRSAAALLEARLGLRLFNCTTRSLTLTVEGGGAA